MKKPFRILFCLLAPLQHGNILFLAKQRSGRLAARLLRFHLRLFHNLDLTELRKNPLRYQPALSPDIIRAIGCLGFIRLNNELLGTLRDETQIRKEAVDERRYMRPGDSRVDAALEQLLKDRSVALVGPSSGADNRDEIDHFDIVVRMGYTGPEGFPENTGTRCDVSFYAPHKMHSMVTKDKLAALRDLRLVVLFKLARYAHFGIDPDQLGIGRDRIACALLPPMRFSTANTLVKALYNCLLCSPSRLKVFNADLFLSTHYPVGYIANKRTVSRGGAWSYENRGMCKSFAISHNPAEQLEFYKHFFYRGAFEADPRLTEIINMPVEQYIERLDALYGVPVRQQAGLE